MKLGRFVFGGILVVGLAHANVAAAAGAPAWMHALINAPVPAHDDETNAVLLYSETLITVTGPGNLKRTERRAYRILRPDGERYGDVRWHFGSRDRVIALRGWAIPASGKDFETREKDIVETHLTDIDGGELISDIRAKRLRIPAATPGNIVGYEVEQEERPYGLTDEWDFQETVPVGEARYSVQVPAGWTYKTFWLNYTEAAPTSPATGQWQWVLKDLKPVKVEGAMPPWRGIAGRMVLSLQPPNGQPGGFLSWQQVGAWYAGLTNGRRDASPEIKQKVQELTASEPTTLARMRALASFVQRDIRYVAIELGIGGHQPHPAAEVFTHRYGDCKDKVTLLSSMLKEIGVESHYVIINTQRGAVTAATPPNIGFNHAILMIQLPAGTEMAAILPAATTHKKLGRVLFFDPTQSLVPFGSLPGYLQSNYGMLVTSEGGELFQLPQPPIETNGVKRTAKLTLDDTGRLQGEVVEVWSGDGAVAQRYLLRAARADVDQIKPVESMLSHSLATFQILKAGVRNLQATEQPLEWHYSLEVDRYAKNAGDLLLIRPRVIGSQSTALLETKEPRVNPIEFEAPERNTDVFEITVPPGYVVDELPPPVNQDLGFVAYHSKTEMAGSVLRYTRIFEIKNVTVPVAKAAELRQFFRVVENDERMSAVLKRSSP